MLINGKLILLVEKENNIRVNNSITDSSGVDGSGPNGARLRIKIEDVGRPGAAEYIKIDIITSKYKTFIFFSLFFKIYKI